MKRDCYLNLNSYAVRYAVALIIWDAVENNNVTAKDISYDNKKKMLKVKGKAFFCTDRHLHYPKKCQHGYALYEFLKSVEGLAPYRLKVL